MNAWLFLVIAAGFFGQSGWEPTRVAVVNVPLVSERYQKTTDLEAQFEQLRQKLTQQREELRDRIERLRRSLQEEIKPGTEAFRERRKQLALLEAEMQWFVESEGQRVEQGLGSSLKDIYADIQRAVRQVAEQRGIDIVLASDQLPEATPESAQQVRQQILLQKVIYWNPRVDITDAVVTQVNENYRRAQEAEPKAAPPLEPHDRSAPRTEPGAAPSPR